MKIDFKGGRMVKLRLIIGILIIIESPCNKGVMKGA